MSTDLFGYLNTLLERKLESMSAQQLQAKIKNYAKSRDLTRVIADILGRNEALLTEISPALAWQIAEAGFPVIAKACRLKGNQLPRQIKKALDSFEATKPVWGRPVPDNPGRAFRPLATFVADTDTQRTETARLFPELAFRLELTVRLTSPLVIKGDRFFSASENPFCVDKLTGWPLVRASTLKGQLRHAAIAVAENEACACRLLFGDANQEKENGCRGGRLRFLPCYLQTNIEFDVLTPHNPKTRRADPGPIFLEVLPKESKLSFWLQYWPLDLMSRSAQGQNGVMASVRSDIKLILKALDYWFREKGIGAKTTAGFGRVDGDEVTVKLHCGTNTPWEQIPFPKENKLKTWWQWVKSDKFEGSWATAWNLSPTKGGNP